MKIMFSAFVLFIQTLHCLASDDSPFKLTNKTTGFCLVKTNNECNDLRWTTADRLLVQQRNKCLGVQGKSVGSEISLYDCDENSDLQKWECKNETVLTLKGQNLYLKLTAENTAVLSKTIGPNNHLIIEGTSSSACARTHRELYAIGGNAAGLPCMFPFQYKDQWYSDCTLLDSPGKQLWCAVETKYQSERWGYCPVTSKEGWTIHPTTGAYYQLNTQAAVTWPQAESSCKQQGASLLSITDPHQQAYITALLGRGGNKLWTGLVLDPEHGWVWSNGRPYRYLKWDSGHPLPNPGHNCAIVEPAVQYSWQSSPCSNKLGYICYSTAAEVLPTQAVEAGFCSSPWILYNGHCFYLNRTQKTWSDAQRMCRNEGGDLISIRNVEDQSFVISQLGFTSTDELWIGLNDRKTEGLFDWTDHSTVSFTSWEFGKPAVSTDIMDCVLIRGENGNWADRVCEEKHGYICMKMSTSKPTGDEVKQDVGCKTGWRRHGSYCYFIGTQTKTFEEAKDDCKSSESYLADVSNGVDNAFLVSLVGLRPEKHFWLGLSNQKDIDQFVWTNTDSVGFTYWNAGMPGHQQGCVSITTGVFAGLWDVLPCTNKEKYICKHLAEGAVLTAAPATTPSPVICPTDWAEIPSRPYCYQLFKQRQSYSRTWYEARDYCKAIGGDLLSIHSAEELQNLPYGYEKVWIGLSAPDPATGYVWSDGSPLQFQHWENGEPNNKNNVESCVEIDIDELYGGGSWNDVHCEKYHGWFCQISQGVTPKAPPLPVAPDYNTTDDGWLHWNGTQYYLNDRSMAMEEARHACKQRHGDLVSINSEAEAVFLWKRISREYRSYWIGLNVDLDGTYGWMDGSPTVFQRWDENQPDFKRNDENCAVMTSSLGFWHDYNCGYEHKSICKRSSTPPHGATVAPTLPQKGGCPQNWKKFESKCYSIINTQKETWTGARTQCRVMGGNLASIHSRSVQGFLSTLLVEAPTTDLWIGAYLVQHYRFLWTDGRPMKYTEWGNIQGYYRMHDIQMSRYEELCAAMSTNTYAGIGKWIKVSCNDTNGYVCLRNVDPSLPDSPEPTLSTGYVKILNDSLKVVNQQMNWDEAKKNCEKDGAKLANLRNKWLQFYTELMAQKIKGPLWIGLNKKETGGYFKFIDGWRVAQTNWDRYEPGSSTSRTCVSITLAGKWKTSDCKKKMASICIKTTDEPPAGSNTSPGVCPSESESSRLSSLPDSWIPFAGYCYLFVTERVEWPEASTQCMRHGGNLTSIGNPSEQGFISNYIKVFADSHGSFWMGLYKTHTDIWKWLDRTTLTYTNWYEDESADNYYGSIKTIDGKWTTSRYQEKGYICKTAKVLKTSLQGPEKPTVDHQTRSHVILVVVLVITVIAIVTAILFKRSRHQVPIPATLTAFDNPLVFNNEQPQPGLADANKLIANM